MTWRSTRWGRWLRWTALYALVFWGGWIIVDAMDGADVFLGFVLVASLVLVYRIGSQYRSWWWVLAPLVVIVPPTYVIPAIGQAYLGWPSSDAGWAFVILLAIIYALASLCAAAAGVASDTARHSLLEGLVDVFGVWK